MLAVKRIGEKFGKRLGGLERRYALGLRSSGRGNVCSWQMGGGKGRGRIDRALIILLESVCCACICCLAAGSRNPPSAERPASRQQRGADSTGKDDINHPLRNLCSVDSDF